MYYVCRFKKKKIKIATIAALFNVHCSVQHAKIYSFFNIFFSDAGNPFDYYQVDCF